MRVIEWVKTVNSTQPNYYGMGVVCYCVGYDVCCGVWGARRFVGPARGATTVVGWVGAIAIAIVRCPRGGPRCVPL